MENGPFIDDLPMKKDVFSIFMFSLPEGKWIVQTSATQQSQLKISASSHHPECSVHQQIEDFPLPLQWGFPAMGVPPLSLDDLFHEICC